MDKLKIKDPGVILTEGPRGGHAYATPDGQLYTGVTTILECRAKEFMRWWPVKEMYNYLMDNWDISKAYTNSEKTKLLEDGKKAHVTRSRDALNIGSKVHDWIEHYIKDGESKLPEEEDVKKVVLSFLDWERAMNISWVASEVVVASHRFKYAGTLDALAYMGNELALIDFKTSSVVSEEYFLQTAAYQMALEEMGVVPEHRIVVRIPKDGSPVEAIKVPTPLDFDKDVFIHLREIHKWNLLIENNFKDRSGKLLCCQNQKVS